MNVFGHLSRRDCRFHHSKAREIGQSLSVAWVAVKELELCYHNGCLYIYMYIIVIWFPQ